jgi:hypothetical protein
MITWALIRKLICRMYEREREKCTVLSEMAGETFWNFSYTTSEYQEDAANFVFLIPFKPALHVPDNNFAHLQEHVGCIYRVLEQCADSAADWWHSWDGNVSPVYRIVGALFQKAVYTKCPEDGRNYRPKHVEQARKGNKNEICCILLW